MTKNKKKDTDLSLSLNLGKEVMFYNTISIKYTLRTIRQVSLYPILKFFLINQQKKT